MRLLDGTGDDNFTAFSYDNDLYTFFDKGGADTLTVERNARLEIANKDTDAATSNTVVLKDYIIGALTLERGAVDTNDFLVEHDDGGLFDDNLLIANDQFTGTNGLTVDVLEVKSASGTVLKSVNLAAAIPPLDLSAGINFQNIYTAFDSSVVALGNIVHGSSIDEQVDRIYGMDDQDDILIGSLGNDVLNGGTGTDEYVWRLGDGDDIIIDDWDDDDLLTISGAGVARGMITASTLGADLILRIEPGVATSDGYLRITGMAAALSTFIADHVEGFVTEAAEQNPTTTNNVGGTSSGETLNGTAANDAITGNGGADTLNGGDGHDILYAHGSTLNGGSGNDQLGGTGSTLNGDDGNDWLNGGTVLHGGSGHDLITSDSATTVTGDDGDDTIKIDEASANISGNAGNDVIYADGTSNIISGGTGDDIITINAGGFTVDGGDDDDVIHIATDGSGTYTASDGSDIIYKNYACDLTLAFASGSIGALTFELQPNGRDVLLTHAGGTILLVGFMTNPGSWFATFGGGSPETLEDVIDELDFSTSTESVTIYGEQVLNLADITTGSASDFVKGASSANEISTGAGQDIAYAGAGNDIVHGGDDSDTIYGEDDDDELYGDAGHDRIFGGAGLDTISGGTGDDVVEGGDGVDTIDGDAGRDVIRGDAGNDILDGGDGDDTIQGGADNDTIYGGGGNDEIQGGDGANAIYGNDGQDVISAGSGSNTVDGGAGNDTIDGNGTLSGGDDDDIISGTGTLNGNDGNDTISGTGALNGGLGNDEIRTPGAYSGDTIHGNDGADLIVGGGTDADVYGDDGADEIYFAGEGNTVEGGAGNDWIKAGHNLLIPGGTFSPSSDSTIRGGTGNDTIIVQGGDHTAEGNEDDDAISVTGDTNLVFGNAGNDAIVILGDANIIDAGDGNNTVSISGEDNKVIALAGSTYITGGADTVIVDFGSSESLPTLNVSYAPNTYDIHVEAAAADVQIGGYVLDAARWHAAFGGAAAALTFAETYTDTSANSSAQTINAVTTDVDDYIHTGSGNDTIHSYDGSDDINAGAGNNSVYAGAGDDIVQAADGINTIDGGSGSDTITTGSGADDVSGGEGNDTINVGDGANQVQGNAGNDLVYGGADNDFIDGGADNDTVYGEAGNDFILGDTGNDTINGGSGDDQIDAGAGDDTVYAGDDADMIDGGAGTDTIFGDDGDDQISGGEGSDQIEGGAGADIILGGDGDGADTLYGDAGDDILLGGRGDDTLQGGANNDTYVFGASDGHDEITDSGTGNIVRFDGVAYTRAGMQKLTGNTNLLINYGGTSGTDSQVKILNQFTASVVGPVYFYGDDGTTVVKEIRTALLNATDMQAGAAAARIFTVKSVETAVNGTTLDGTDYLYGDGNNNTLTGRYGNDVLRGGAGNDTYFWNMDNGNDTIADSSGTDTLTFGAGITYEMVNWGGGTVTIDTGTSSATISVAGLDTISGTHYADFGYTEAFDIIGGTPYSGTSAADIFGGTSSSDDIAGDTGNDVLSGDDGDDLIIGGDGADELYGEADNDRLEGDADDVLLSGGIGNDYLIDGKIMQGDEGNDYIVAGDISASLSYDVDIFGNSENDRVVAYVSGSFVSGGTEEDLIRVTGNDNTVYGDREDPLTPNSGAFDSIYVTGSRNEVFGDDGNDVISSTGGSILADANILDGNAGDDIFHLIDGYNRVKITGEGVDIIYNSGTVIIDLDDMDIGDLSLTYVNNTRDAVLTFDGGTVRLGRYATDTADWYISIDGASPVLINTLAVNDITTSTDVQYVYGQNLSLALIETGSNGDVIYAGDTSNTINSGAGQDQVYAGGGADTINGGNGIDLLFGGGGDDIINGDAGHDQLEGGEGEDTLSGGTGDDIMDGGDDDDLIVDNTGADVMTGGAGDDTFLFAADSLDEEFNLITDFSLIDDDVIDLSALLEAYDPITEAITNFISVSVVGSDTILSVDAAGTGSGYVDLVTVAGVATAYTVEDMVTLGKLLVEAA